MYLSVGQVKSDKYLSVDQARLGKNHSVDHVKSDKYLSVDQVRSSNNHSVDQVRSGIRQAISLFNSVMSENVSSVILTLYVYVSITEPTHVCMYTTVYCYIISCIYA